MPAAGLSALVAPAKINLALHVTGRRADGYHLIDSVAVFADRGDRIEIAPADVLTLSISGPFAAHAPADHTNLAWRAAEAFFERADIASGAALTIDKQVPAGSGFGGGSADAAAVLAGLNQATGKALADQDLAGIGLRIGADVPMCLGGRALRARGIGEQIEKLVGLPALPLVLVWPGRAVATAETFAALTQRENPPLVSPERLETATAVAAWLAECRNDLEAPALAAAPEIATALDALRGSRNCLLARMSGSGSGCFGLYATSAEAEAASADLASLNPDWWVRAVVAR